jgi:hypothetical protein
MRKALALLALTLSLGLVFAVPAASADTCVGTCIDPASVDTGSGVSEILAAPKATDTVSGGFCELTTTTVLNAPTSYQGTTQTTCFADFDVWIDQRVCLQRGWVGQWQNVRCSHNAGWDALPNGAFHFCTSHAVEWDWRTRTKTTYAYSGGGFTTVHPSFKKTGLCY